MKIISQNHFGIGIDTARYGHHVSFMDQQKRTAGKAFHFKEDAQGYEALREAVERLMKKHPDATLHIHVDAAGQYAENLLHWLHLQNWPAVISVGQPARNKAYRKVHYDKRKADPVESLACARFGVIEQPEPMLRPAVEFSGLRDAVAQMEASATARTRLVNQLHNMLARAFPELAVIVKDIAKISILKLLQKYPTAKRLATAKLDSISKLPHINAELATKLLESAKRSTAANSQETVERLIKQKVAAIFVEIQTHAELAKIVQDAVKTLPDGPHRRMRSIPGIGPQTEAALIAKVVTIDRFRSDSALIGYFGIFPEEVDVSGTNKDGSPKTGTELKMSRKGNDLVRRLLYTAAQTAVIHNPPVRALFARLSAAGKPYDVAIGHCMAKLLRQVFALWSKDCDFDPTWETSTQEESAQALEPTSVQGSASAQAPVKVKVVGHSQAQSPISKVVTTTGSMVTSKRPAINFAQLREQVTMPQVLELIGWTGRGNTDQSSQRGACPVHRSTNAKSTSFAVNTTQQVYCCHSCGSQGNALDLWAATQGLSIFDAAWDLIERLDLTAPLLKAEKENCTV